MGPEGGDFTSLDATGHPLATLVVPEGSFDHAVVLSLKPADVTQSAPIPDGIEGASAPVDFEVSENSKKEIALIMPAPADWNLDDATKSFWLVSTVQVNGSAPRKAPMMLV